MSGLAVLFEVNPGYGIRIKRVDLHGVALEGIEDISRLIVRRRAVDWLSEHSCNIRNSAFTVVDLEAHSVVKSAHTVVRVVICDMVNL